ncbi:MAG: hypothetical protein ACR2MG_12835 [Pyrinomonadaceae bacterium]
MKNPVSENKSCGCHANVERFAVEVPESQTKNTVQSVPSILLSVLIAFFPKCPLCWAAYMSMLGSFGVSSISYTYMRFLLPILIAFLVLHLFLLLKKVKEKGYGPFLLSLTGAIIIICGRTFLSFSEPAFIAGIVLVVSGSLWNSFSVKNIFFKPKINAGSG